MFCGGCSRLIDDHSSADLVRLGGSDAGVVAPLLAGEPQGVAEVGAALVPLVHVTPPPAIVRTTKGISLKLSRIHYELPDPSGLGRALIVFAMTYCGWSWVLPFAAAVTVISQYTHDKSSSLTWWIS